MKITDGLKSKTSNPREEAFVSQAVSPAVFDRERERLLQAAKA
jgi:hypothetical protein